MFTVADALKLDALERAQCIAGETGLQRNIRWVHIVSMPENEAYEWTKGGELILTVGFDLLKNPGRQRQLVSTLVEHEIAALLFSMGHYIDEVPQVIIDDANRLNFPIITLPGDVPFVDVTEAVFTQVINEQYALQQRVQQILGTLTDVVLAGGTLQGVVEALAQFINTSITIENVSFEVLASVQHGVVDTARRRSIENGRTTPEVVDYLFELGTYKRLLSTHKPAYIPPMAEIGLELGRVIAPIIVDKSIIGYLWIITDGDKLTAMDELAVIQGATVAALIMYKEREIQATQAKIRGDFLNLLLELEGKPTPWLESQASIIGFHLDWYFQVLVIESGQPANDDVDSLLRLIDSYMESVSAALVSRRRNKIVIILQTRHKPNGAYVARELVQQLSYPQLRLLVGVGNLARSSEAISTSYEQAEEALTIARNLNWREGIIQFEELGLLHWLNLLPSSALQSNRYYRALNKLAKDDQLHRRNSLYTLDIFLQTGGVIKDAAQKLFIHRNTLLYRLERIEAIIELDLKDYDTLVNLSVALQAYRLNENSQND